MYRYHFYLWQKTVYKNCWLSGKNSITLSGDAPTEYVKWDATFMYNGISEEPLEVSLVSQSILQ